MGWVLISVEPVRNKLQGSLTLLIDWDSRMNTDGADVDGYGHFSLFSIDVLSRLSNEDKWSRGNFLIPCKWKAYAYLGSWNHTKPLIVQIWCITPVKIIRRTSVTVPSSDTQYNIIWISWCASLKKKKNQNIPASNIMLTSHVWLHSMCKNMANHI